MRAIKSFVLKAAKSSKKTHKTPQEVQSQDTVELISTSHNLINAARKRKQTRMKSDQPLTPIEAYLKSQHLFEKQIDKTATYLRQAEESFRKLADENSRYSVKHHQLLNRLKEIVNTPASYNSSEDLIIRLKELISQFEDKTHQHPFRETSSGISSHEPFDSDEDFEEKPNIIEVPLSIEISRHHTVKNNFEKVDTGRKDLLTKALGSTLVKFQLPGLSDRLGTHNSSALDLNMPTPKNRVEPGLFPQQDPSVCDEWTEVGGLQLPKSFKQDHPIEPTKNLRYLLSSKKHSLLGNSSSQGIAANSSISHLSPFEHSGISRIKKNESASNRILQITDSQHRIARQSNTKQKVPEKSDSLIPNG